MKSLLDTIHQKDLEIAKLKEMLGLSDKADVMMMDEKKGKKIQAKEISESKLKGAAGGNGELEAYEEEIERATLAIIWIFASFADCSS